RSRRRASRPRPPRAARARRPRRCRIPRRGRRRACLRTWSWAALCRWGEDGAFGGGGDAGAVAGEDADVERRRGSGPRGEPAAELVVGDGDGEAPGGDVDDDLVAVPDRG